ncbi:MAG: YaiI/YqxD family protein [Alphaproteobacteria bacterium]
MTAIYVDADACPVKDEVIRVAERHNVTVHIVSNGGIRPYRETFVKTVIVPHGPDIADDWIADHAGPGDVVITADIPLAARCLENKAHVLNHTGKPFEAASIGMRMAMRDLNAHLRETGEISGYNPGFTAKDRSQFLNMLENTVRAARLSEPDKTG